MRIGGLGNTAVWSLVNKKHKMPAEEGIGIGKKDVMN